MPITAVRSTTIKAGFDFDNDGFADPGDVLTHSLIITNTEAFALTGLTIEETLAGITTVPGSVMIGPIANNDVFNMIGNTSITLTKAQLIGNDIDPDGAEANMTVTINLASDVNGTIIDNGNETYTFTANVGFEGTASFTYSLTDEQGVTSVSGFDGLVNLNVDGMAWFIDNNAAGSTNVGTQANPFTSIASFNAVNDGIGTPHPESGDNIYLREGTGTYSAADGINLLNGQILTGQGENLVVNHGVAGNIIVETGAAVDTPVIVVTGAGNQGIQLGQNNTISGLDVGMNNATATGISDGGGTVGNLVISNVAVGTASFNTGSAVDIDQGGTLNVQLDAVRSTGAVRAIDLGTTTGLSGTGNGFTVTGTTQIDDATGDGIAISNSSLNATFTGKVTILNDAGAAVVSDGVDLLTNTGTYNFNGGVDITVNGTGAFGLRGQSSGTINIVDPASNTNQIVSSAGTALLINPTQLNATLDLVQSGGGANGISLSGMTGSLVIDRAVISNYTGVGLQITNSDGSVTINDGGAGSTIGTGTTGDAVNISGGTGAVTIGADITKTTAGNVVDISTHTTGNVNLSGAISATGGVANGITLTNNTGGVDINLTGTVTLNTGSNTAFNFTNNQATGADVSLSNGNLNIDTTSGAGINASSSTVGAGSLTIGGASQNNSVDTTGGGRAITIDGVTAHVQLHDSDYSGGSGDTAIFLRNTGASGDFAITGTGSTAGSGGVIAMNAGGADGAITQGIGIYLENAANISLTNLDFNGTFNNFGIRGLNVNNFTLRDSELSAGATFGTLSNVTTGEGVIRFGNAGSGSGLTGIGLLEGNVIGNGRFDNVAVWNYTNATSLNLTIRDSANDAAIFNANQVGGNDSLFIETGGSHNLTLLVGGEVDGSPNQGVQFTGVVGDHIQTNAVGQSVQNITIDHNIFTQTLADGIGAGGGIRVGGGSTVAGTDITVNYQISNNSLKGALVSAMDLRFNGLAGDINGIILNNTLGTSNGSYDSTLGNRGAGPFGYGIWAGSDRPAGLSGTLNYAMRIEGNTIRDTGDAGITLVSNNSGGAGTVVVEATIFNNSIAELNSSGLTPPIGALYLVVGGASAGDDGRMGVTITGNNFNTANNAAIAAPIVFDQLNGATSHFYVPGIGGPFSGAAADAALTNFLDPPANTLTSGNGDLVEGFSVIGLTGETLTLPVPIMAAAMAGADWETAIHDWLANYQPPAPPTGDTGSGGGTGSGGTGGGGDGGAGDPPPPPEPPHPVIVDDGVLSQAELDYFVEAAIQHWTDAGATAGQVAEMRATAISVADMSGTYLGTSDATSIRIDSDGAGHGWFLDRTPGDNAEYQGVGTRLIADSGPAAGKMDLLTVLMHEFGHQVGLDDVYGAADADELMYGYANLGERRLPQADDLANADPDQVSHESFLLAPTLVGTLPAGKAVKILWESVVDTFSNQLIPNPFGFFSTISGSNFGTFNSNTENLVVDSLTLSGTIWNDNGAGGGTAANGTKDGTEAGVDGVLVSLFVDANNDNVADTPGTPLATTTTGGGGNYSFTNLAEGNYLVRVDQDNFDAGGNTSLVATPLSPITSPEPFDPDNNVNNDDNGARVVGQPAWSNAITLNYNSETVNDGTGQFDINDTLDFGFFGNSPPVLADLGGDISTFTEDGAAVLLDDSSVPELAATVTDANQPQLNGGTLTVSITANEDAADDLLGISTAGTVTLSSGTSVGSIVSVGGLAIGTITADGNGGDDLAVSLNTNDATLANVTTLIRSLTYANADTANPSTLQRTVAVTLADGLGGSDSENVFVNVIAVNDPPTGADNTITIDEDDFGDIDAADFGFNDVDGDSLSAVTITGVTGGTFYYDSGNDGFDPGDAVSTFPITVTAADLAGNLVAFRAGPNVNGTGIGTITFQVVDDSGAGNDTDTSVNTLTVDVAPINDQPDVPASLADVNATEGVLAAVSGITVSDVDLDALNAGAGDYDGAIFGIGQAVPDASDSFAIDTTGASFTISGNQLQVGGLEFATFTVGGGALGIAFNSNGTIATTTLVNEVLSRIQYVTNADDPPATLTLTYFLIDGAPGAGQGTVVGGNNIDAGTVDVNITAVNDEPTLSATAVSPTFTEGDAARDLFSTVAASTVEAGQTFTSMTLTVTNVTDFVDEKLSIDGSIVSLINGMFIGTANNGLTVNVTVVGTTATVTFDSATLTQAQLETLVDGLAYRNDSQDPTDANRVVTITELVDSGSNVAPNDNTTALSIASTVDVEPVNDPSVAGDDSFSVNEGGSISDTVFTNDSDIDGPLLVIEVNGAAGNVDNPTPLSGSGGNATIGSNGAFSFSAATGFGYLITAADAAATGAVNDTAVGTIDYTLEGGDTATVTVTINGIASVDDELWGDSGNNTITDTIDADYFNLSQGGDDSAFGQGGNDIVNFGAEFTPADSFDGGAGFDFIGLLGDYATTPLVLAATSLVNVELILALGGSFDVTSNDGNVASGETLTVDGGYLGALDTLTFDGTAETDGRFILVGGSGDDDLTGGARDDRLFGGAGDNDLDGGAGNGDIVNYALAAGAVTLDLSAGMATDNGFGDQDLLSNIENVVGSDFDDSLTGDGEINVLDGGLGADTMTGGDGSDGYVVDNVGDVVIETSAAGGVDIVRSSVSFTLGANVDNLDLTGIAAINGTGNDDANTITGNLNNNILNGGLGADFLRGGFGDDTYVVDNVGDAINEFLGQGTDTVQSSITYTLGFGLENLNLTGAGAIDGTGNIFANSLIGNANSNTLDGKAGADTMNGGLGNDTYIVDNVGDVVTETSAVGGTDIVLSSATFTLGSNIENLTLTGANAINGTGNSLVNTIIGNSAANVLDGKGGADTMTGGLGNDTYVIDNVGDVAVELAGEGTDTIQTAVTATLAADFENLTLLGTGNVNGTGNGVNNVLTGNSGANTLNGLVGADTMIGNGGNDVYVVDNGLDQVIETAGGGTDTVNSSISYTLAAEIENLTLTGTGAINGAGNGLANTINGNDFNNILTGGLGADTLKGGLGDDTYVVDDAGDSVSDLAGQGTDTVLSSVSFTLGGATENLNLTGAGAINATGNIFANVLNGNTNANVLNGGGGADTMNAGLGNDTYIVDNAGDVVIETSVVGGTDEVQSSVNFTLGSNLENLTLTGASAVNGTGNGQANILTGNGQANVLNGQANDDTLNGAGGADSLHGGLGNDSLEGGAGNDGFYFENALIATNVDSVLDFTAVNDTFFLDDAVFTALAAGTLAAGAFVNGNTALDASDRILYDSATGNIFYDADGSGGGASAILFATVTPGTAITNVDFVVF